MQNNSIMLGLWGVIVALSLTMGVFDSNIEALTAKVGGNNPNAKNYACTTIQSGQLLRSDNVTIVTGFDEWGYNYQGHMFNGFYCDSYRDAGWCQPYKDVRLLMKWNDAWLSNKDCDADSLLYT